MKLYCNNKSRISMIQNMKIELKISRWENILLNKMLINL